MNSADVVFWIIGGVLAFGFALAVQMRLMIALVLRRALTALFGESADHASAVREATVGSSTSKESQHLVETYPRPLAHMRLARRWSLILPVLLLGLIAARRFTNGGIL